MTNCPTRDMPATNSAATTATAGSHQGVKKGAETTDRHHIDPIGSMA